MQRLPSIDGMELSFLDANKDGLGDILLGVGNQSYLFVNTGEAFEQVVVSGLDAIPAFSSRPLPFDAAGSGDAEVFYVDGGKGYSVALDAPDTGLMVAADDGRGNVLRWTYRRAPASALLRHRASVLGAFTVESTGHEPLTYEYAYANPVLHSQGLFLIGFDQVTRRGALGTEEIHFLNEDRYSSVLLDLRQLDDLVPDVERVTFRHYDDASTAGIAWKRPSSEGTGWRSTNPLKPEVAVDQTEYLAYESEVCPSAVRNTTQHGVLLTEKRRATLPSWAKHLGCLDEHIVETGTHADPALDFRHEGTVHRTAVGLADMVTLSGPVGDLNAGEATYAADGRVLTSSRPGRGTSTVEYEASARLVAKVTAPDGVVTAAAERDPTSDALRAVTVTRGNLTERHDYRFDGQERLAKTWDNLGGASESLPNQALTYRYASGSQPGLLKTTTLIDAAARSVIVSANVQTAAGDSLAVASLIPEGWAFTGMHSYARSTRQSSMSTRPATASDVATLSTADLVAGASAVDTRQSSAFGAALSRRTKLHADVERTLVTSLVLDGGLVRSEIENDTLTTSEATDPQGRVLRRKDAAGATTRAVYDALGRLRQVTLADGTRHRAALDGYGRPSRIDRDGIGSVTYAYDATSGLLRGRAYASVDGTPVRRVSLRYDAAGRLVEEVDTTDAPPASTAFAWLYDGATPSEPTKKDRLGLLTAVVGDGYVKTLQHRADGSVKSSRVALAGWRTIDTEIAFYDDSSRREKRTTVRDAAGGLREKDVQTALRDGYGRDSGADLNGSALVRYAYDREGLPLWAHFTGAAAHDEVVTLTHDPLTRLQVGVNQNNASWASAVSMRLNKRGLVDHEDIQVGGVTRLRAYEYSPTAFLTKSSDAETLYEYAYDAAGLPSAIDSTIGGVKELRPFTRAGDTLTAGSHHHRFDGAGRVVERDDVTLTYGPNGQVARAQRGAQVWTYLYDELGQRVAKLVDGVPVAAYLADGSILDGTSRLEPVRFAGQVVGVLRHSGVGGSTFQMIATDARATVLADADGTARLPSPFGDRSARPDFATAIDYATKGYDADLGVVRMGVRDYDPNLSRFLQPDPLFFERLDKVFDSAADGNLYSYARNNPLLFIDPSGQEPQWMKEMVTAWNAFRQRLTNAVFDSAAYDKATQANLQKVGPNPTLDATDAIVRQTPDAAGNAFLVFAGGAEPKGPRPPGATEVAPESSTPATEKTAMEKYWPPNRGFNSTPIEEVLRPGTLVDRYGYDGGTFVSPAGTPFEMRGLPPESRLKPLSTFEVVKPITVQSGQAAPAFGSIGLGPQIELPSSVADLIKAGSLKRVQE